MISTVFGKTRPINFIFIILFTFLFFFGVHLFLLKTQINVYSIFKLLGSFFLVLFSVFLTNFISKKNGLTKDNTYAILVFVLALSFFPYTFSNDSIIISNVFIFLALRRIISLKTYHDIKLKLFDSSLWICVATIFHEWALLFFFLVFVAILHYGLKDIRNWFIPLVAIFIVVVFVISFYYFTDRMSDLPEILTFRLGLDLDKYTDLKYLIPLLFTLSIGFLAIFSYFKNIKVKLSEEQSSILLIIVSFFIGLFIVLLSDNKNNSEFIFTAFPLAVLIANYIEVIGKKWFKEVLLWMFILLPFFILML